MIPWTTKPGKGPVKAENILFHLQMQHLQGFSSFRLYGKGELSETEISVPKKLRH